MLYTGFLMDEGIEPALTAAGTLPLHPPPPPLILVAGNRRQIAPPTRPARPTASLRWGERAVRSGAGVENQGRG